MNLQNGPIRWLWWRPSRLSGAKFFIKIYRNKGFWQIPPDKSHIKLTTCNAPSGRHQFS